MSDKTYDTIKLIALICTPWVAFLAALATIWSVPHAQEITASLTALDTLLGALVVVLAREYNKKVPSEFDKEVDTMGAGDDDVDVDEDGDGDE